MAHRVTIIELRNMQVADLAREARGLRNDVAKMKIGITLGKQKDTGGYRSAKRQLSRMLTILTEKERNEKQGKEEKGTAVSATLPAPKSSKQSSSSKK